MYNYEYPRACITTDIICICNKHILLIKRKNDPFKDMWALPGGYFDPKTDQNIMSAASRELEEETGIKHRFLDFVTYKDKIDRDPRDRTVTFVFSCFLPYHIQPTIKAGDDAAETKWLDVENLWYVNLAFDHKQILKEFFKIKILS